MSKISFFRKRRRKSFSAFGCSLEYSYGCYISMMWYVGCPLLSVDIIKVMRLVGEGGTRATAPLSHHTRPLFSSLVPDIFKLLHLSLEKHPCTYWCSVGLCLEIVTDLNITRICYEKHDCFTQHDDCQNIRYREVQEIEYFEYIELLQL